MWSLSFPVPFTLAALSDTKRSLRSHRPSPVPSTLNLNHTHLAFTVGPRSHLQSHHSQRLHNCDLAFEATEHITDCVEYTTACGLREGSTCKLHSFEDLGDIH